MDHTDVYTSFERSELDELKSSLISSLEGEVSCKVKSEPSSPQRSFRPSRPLCDLVSAFPVDFFVFAPSSPFRSSALPRTLSVKDLVSRFEAYSIPTMGDSAAASSEAAERMGQVSSAKGCITRHLKTLEVHENAGTLVSSEFTKVFNKVQLQIDKFIDLDEAV